MDNFIVVLSITWYWWSQSYIHVYQITDVECYTQQANYSLSLFWS